MKNHEALTAERTLPARTASPSPTILSLIEQRHHLRKALAVAQGYMTNAAIDLETGAPKKTALATINGGLKQIREALLAADDMAVGDRESDPAGTASA